MNQDTFSFDTIKQFLEDFDPAALLPDLEPLMGNIVTILQAFLLIAPVVLVGLGLVYFLLPPKEANHSFGYRFFWGMSSVECWRFTQKLAGLVFGLAGLVLTIVMLSITKDFVNMETMDMVSFCCKCLLWELVVVAACHFVVDITVVIFFNRHGIRRPFTLPKEK